LLAARLQNIEQLLSADAHKTVSARANGAAFEQQFNVVPMVEGLLNLISCFAVPLTHVVHRGV